MVFDFPDCGDKKEKCFLKGNYVYFLFCLNFCIVVCVCVFSFLFIFMYLVCYIFFCTYIRFL